MKLLAGKRAIVTGGASGIGRAIVLEFLKEGAAVIALDKNDGALEKLHSEAKVSQFGGGLFSLTLDLTQKEKVEEAFTADLFRAVDILVNSAGVDFKYSIEEPDEAIWEKVMETNLNGSRYLTELLIEEMIREKNRGSIIFITSVHANLAFHNALAYDTSKNALRGYTRTLALNVAKYGIRVNDLAPGMIYPTGITGTLDKEKAKEYGKKIPMGRPGKPEEVAAACVFLASEKASYITGAQLLVDGGFSIVGAFSS